MDNLHTSYKEKMVAKSKQQFENEWNITINQLFVLDEGLTDVNDSRKLHKIIAELKLLAQKAADKTFGV